jgi:hypothetical protein
VKTQHLVVVDNGITLIQDASHALLLSFFAFVALVICAALKERLGLPWVAS